MSLRYSLYVINTIINTNDTLDTNNFRNEFDISYSESLSYVEMPIPDIMLRIADFVFSGSPFPLPPRVWDPRTWAQGPWQ